MEHVKQMKDDWITIIKMKEEQIIKVLAKKKDIKRAIGEAMVFITEAQDSLEQIRQGLAKINTLGKTVLLRDEPELEPEPAKPNPKFLVTGTQYEIEISPFKEKFHRKDAYVDKLTIEVLELNDDIEYLCTALAKLSESTYNVLVPLSKAASSLQGSGNPP